MQKLRVDSNNGINLFVFNNIYVYNYNILGGYYDRQKRCRH